MTDNLVTRLRGWLDEDVPIGVIMNEAADRIAQLEAALREAALELDAYYRAEYPGDHPYSKKKLAEAMASNPARAALGGENDQ